jgi:20S proteasome alpha/beta subunit
MQRFLPNTSKNSLGSGALFRYDALGSREQVRTLCVGKGEQLISPFLDKLSNFEEDDSLWKLSLAGTVLESQQHSASICVNISCEEAIDVTVKAFRAAAEREISIGDGIEVCIIKKLDGGTCSDHAQQRILVGFDSNHHTFRSLMSPKLFSIERKFFSLPRH